MIEAIHYELECALDDPAAEVTRLLDMQKLTYSPLSSICAQCLEEGGQGISKPVVCVLVAGTANTAPAPKCGHSCSHWALTRSYIISIDDTIAAESSASQGPVLI